jgi:hypothetical protein
LICGNSDRSVQLSEVRVPAQRNPLGLLHGLAVDDDERVPRFFADVDSAAVRGYRNPMGRFDPLDLSYHLVRGGIDDVDVIPGGVRLDDPLLHVLRGQQGIGRRAQNDPSQNCEAPTRHLFVGHRLLLFSTTSYPPEALSGDRSVIRRYFAFAPSTNAFSVCHSGSFCELNCWPPP